MAVEPQNSERRVAPLSVRLIHEFDAGVRARGQRYFFEKKVVVTRGSAADVEAKVAGGAIYRVRIEARGRVLGVGCECAYFAGGEPCKHVWATLLAVELQPNCLTEVSSGRLGVVPMWDTDAEDDDDEEDFDDGIDLDLDDEDTHSHIDAGRIAFSHGALRSRVEPPSIDQRWESLVAQVSHASRPLPRQPRIIGSLHYLIDVPSTIATGAFRVSVSCGDGARASRVGLHPGRVHEIEDADDRFVATLLLSHWAARGYYGGSSVAEFDVPADAHDALLPALCRTGRCRVRTGKDGISESTLELDDGPSWSLRLEADATRRTRPISLRGQLVRGTEVMEVGLPWLVLANGWMLADGRAARFGAACWPWLLRLRLEGGISVPRKQQRALLDLLCGAEGVQFDLCRDFGLRKITATPRARVRIDAAASIYVSPKRNAPPVAALSFDYAGCSVPEGAPGRTVIDGTGSALLERDRSAENQAIRAMTEAGFSRLSTASSEHQWRIAAAHLPKAVRKLVAHDIEVRADGKLFRRASRLTASVASGIDWFDLTLAADFGGAGVAVPRLLEAIAKGDDTVLLDDGALGILPEEWLRRWQGAARLGRLGERGIRFDRVQVALLDALFADDADVTADKAFERARTELRSFAGVEPCSEPPGFVGQLRGYQREGLGWLRFLRRFGLGGCLADDMGLGKTVQLLALVTDYKSDVQRTPAAARAWLVVAPRSLVWNWANEAKRFAPDLRVLDHTGAGRLPPGTHFDEYDLVLTTYGTLRRDIVAFRDVTFDTVVVDEAQMIKNASSDTAKAARLLRATHRLALTGTPIENHMGELWSLFEFLNPGMLGSSRALFGAHGRNNVDAPTRDLVARALRPLILRRKKEQVARDLPGRVEETLVVDLEPSERERYDELRDHYRRSLLSRVARHGLARSKIHVLEALLRLRQAACHPGLLDRDLCDEPSAKLDLLLDRIDSVLGEGHKALVFSQFTSLLSIVRRRLDASRIEYEYLDGRTRDREARVARFQGDASCGLFLISLKAGGVGLNLTAADYVFLLDPWWNPAVEAQAIDRSHRIGQTRSVFAYRFIARATVEEKVAEMQRTKRELADAILREDNALIRDLGQEELELLLS